jgi:hypothetical protein
MKIPRHPVDEDLVKEMFSFDSQRLEPNLERARSNPKSLDSLIDATLKVVALGCVIEPQSPLIRKALKLGAQAHAAMFAAIGSSSNPMTVPLGDGDPVTYSSEADESTVHVGRWIMGFYMNVLCDDAGGLDLMCRTSPDILRRSSTKSPEYDYLYMEALQLFRSGTQETGNKIVAALKATNPANAEVFDSDWSLYLVGHQLEVLMYVATQEPEFGPALAKAVEHHKKYWSKTNRLRRNYKGYISFELTALAKLARARGLTFDVESPYLATQLL